jgi:hypothetical protein
MLTPEHDKRYPSSSATQQAHDYVDSVVLTADDSNKLMWYGWALREAFLAGITYQKNLDNHK